MRKKEYLTPQDVARMLMVSPVTVRQWAQRGEIEAATTPGGHRRFTREAVLAFASRRGLRVEGGEVPLRVLVVDDDEHLNRWLTLALNEADRGIEARSAFNGFEAGVQMETFRPEVVLLDLLMPDLDGFEVCRFIKRDPVRAATRIIAMTAYPSEHNLVRIREAGAEACLCKPVDLDHLLGLLGRCARLADA